MGNKELVEFGSIARLKKGKKPAIQSDQIKEGYLPYVDIKAFETGNIANYTDGEKCVPCKDGDILIVCDGSRSGLVGRAINGYVGSTLALITADDMSSEYLYYFLQGKYALLNTKKKGTGTPHLNQDILFQQKLLVPSIEEQNRIVARIEELFSELDKGVETLQKTKQQLAVYRHAVLKDVFSGITERETIRKMSSIVTSGSRGWAKYYSDCGAKFIRIGNLTRDSIRIDLSDIQYVKLPENAEGKRTQLKPSDVLVSITADLGSIGFVPEGIEEAYVNQHIAMIRFNNSAQSKMMAWYLKSDLGQKDLLKNKRGGGKLGLGLDDIRDTGVPVMSDEDADMICNNIEARLSLCDNLESMIEDTLQKVNALRQSVLKQAFEGRL